MAKATKKEVKRKKKILAGELPPDEKRIESIMKSVEKMREVLDENMDGLAARPHQIPQAMLNMVRAAKEIRDFSVGAPETYDEIVVSVPGLEDEEDGQADTDA